ncbi:MAG TPA: ImmA/IrrE family metallo-endopeptidase [Firmicutes bacterium]|nr:ImmA/IrrE family metallo-endopeptidase [Bacillota bacterium]
MPDNLIALAKKNKIILMLWDFKPPIEAVFYSYPGKNPVIGLDYRIVNDQSHFRCVLAEELGHFFTTPRESIITHYHCRSRIRTYREEYQAMVWAVNYLIPDHELELALNHMPAWELIDFFRVDPEFLAFKLKLSKDRLLAKLS